MSVLIPKPVSLAELRSGKLLGNRNEIMLDEADTILESLLDCTISAATFRDNDIEKTWRGSNQAIRGRDNIIARCAFHKSETNEQKEGW